MNNDNLSYYYSFDKKPKIKMSCQNDYEILADSIVKSGSYGTISEVCKKKKCKYIVKASPFRNLDAKHAFLREALIAPMMAEINVGPKIHDIFVCLNVGYIIMDKWQGSFREIVNSATIDDTLYLDDILKLIKKMHKHNVVHNDLHLNNILYNRSKSNTFTFCIIDYGWALYFENKNSKIPVSYVPRPKIPNIFFPTYDYYTFSVRLEKMKYMFYPVFFTDNLISLKDYLILNKYSQYIDNIKNTQPLLLSEVTFYKFLKAYKYTKYLIKDINTTKNNSSNSQENISMYTNSKSNKK